MKPIELMRAYSEIERLWIVEAKRRLDAYRRGDIEAVSGDEVMRRARYRLSQEFLDRGEYEDLDVETQKLYFEEL